MAGITEGLAGEVAPTGGKNDEAPMLALRSSVKLTTNSKGHTWEVRVVSDGDDLESMRQAVEVTNTIDRELAAAHGYPWARG